MTAILHAGFEGTQRLAYMLDFEIHLSLADRASMRQSGAVVDFGTVNESGSDTSRETFTGLDGADSFSATAAEDTDVASTAISNSYADFAVARAAMRRDVGDLFVLTGPRGKRIDPRRLAGSMAGEWEAYWMSMLANTVDGAATAVGTSTVNMSVDDQFDAIFALELLAVPGPYFELLHNRQFADFQSSLRGEGGAIQFMAATAEMLKLNGPGNKGSFLGALFFTSNKVNAAGGNRYGALWGLGAVGVKYGTMEPPIGAEIVRPDAEIVVEFQRDASKAITEVIGHGYAGMNITEQDRIIGIVTDD